MPTALVVKFQVTHTLAGAKHQSYSTALILDYEPYASVIHPFKLFHPHFADF